MLVTNVGDKTFLPLFYNVGDGFQNFLSASLSMNAVRHVTNIKNCNEHFVTNNAIPNFDFFAKLCPIPIFCIRHQCSLWLAEGSLSRYLIG